MPEYIDKEKLYQYLDNEVEWRNNQDRLFALESVSDFPAADVSPVVHGKWKCLDGSQKHYCSVCGMDFDLYACVKKLFNYCPNCGARCDI